MSIQELKQRCSGRWPDIVTHLASQSEMVDAINRGHLRHGLCPVHGGNNADAFRVFPDFDITGGAICNTCGSFPNGIELLMWLNDWQIAETAKAIDEYLLGTRVITPPRRQSKVIMPVKAIDHPGRPSLSSLEKIWSQSCALSSKNAVIAQQYFYNRGIASILDADLGSVRFHPELPCYHGKKLLGNYPAIVSMVTDADGQFAGLHRTYLDAKGFKAAVPLPKKTLVASHCTISGGAVRLFDSAPVIGIAEGIENALAVYCALKMPVWAATNTSLMGSLVIPKSVRKVIIWADYDKLQNIKKSRKRIRAGHVAANKLATRLHIEGREVIIEYPAMLGREGVDWNDVLVERGPAAFPVHALESRPLPSLHVLSRLMAL